MRLWLLLVALYSIAYAKEEKKDAKGAEKAENPLAHGFSGDIDWVEWHNAIGVAKDLKKPIMLIVHKTWCGACKRLKSEFATAPQTPELVKLSKKFVMVNVQDDEEPEEQKYAPDGGYIPRVLFLDTDAEPLLTNNQKRYKNNKYFYPFVPELVEGMKRALEEFKEIERGGRRPTLSKNAAGEQVDTKARKKEEEEKEEYEKEEQESKTEKKKDSKKDEKKTEEKMKEEKKADKKKLEQEKKEKEKKKKEEEEKEDEEEKEKVTKKKEDKQKEDKKKVEKKKEDEEEEDEEEEEKVTKKKEDKKRDEKKKEDKKKEDKKKEDKKKDDKKKADKKKEDKKKEDKKKEDKKKEDKKKDEKKKDDKKKKSTKDEKKDEL